MFANSILFSVGFSALAFGCVSNSGEDETQETIDNLIQAGYPAGDVRIDDGKVYVGHDAEVSLQASREMLQTVPGKEQYRTRNLVGGPNPSIICINGAIFTDATYNEGFNRALENYRQLFEAGVSRLLFVRVTGPTAGCTFFINSVFDPKLPHGGGMSGFPSLGAPFGTIRISDNFNVGKEDVGKEDLVEQVITHEIGHTIGLRHSDYFDPNISCGEGRVNEGAGGDGAILIPGTPSGATRGGSLMNACYDPDTENGEFRSSDITAIDALY